MCTPERLEFFRMLGLVKGNLFQISHEKLFVQITKTCTHNAILANVRQGKQRPVGERLLQAAPQVQQHPDNLSFAVLRIELATSIQSYWIVFIHIGLDQFPDRLIFGQI
jgi:hypothetical protein